MNSYLRNFVHQSIYDWVNFIKGYTLPDYDKGECWPRSKNPMLIVTLSYKKPAKSGKPKRKPIDETLPEEEQEAIRQERLKEDELYMYRLEFSPTMQEIHDFYSSALTMIIGSTNKVLDLQKDLMKSLS
jgi:hypothetical protein